MTTIRRMPLLFILLCTALPAVADLYVENAWVRAGPPTARVLGAYAEIHNHGEAVQAVVAVESPDFERAELHRTVVEDGVARMVAVERIEVPVHGVAALEPGADHIMLIGPKRTLAEGDRVTITLRFADGGSVGFEAPLKRRHEGSGHHDHNHDRH